MLQTLYPYSVDEKTNDRGKLILHYLSMRFKVNAENVIVVARHSKI